MWQWRKARQRYDLIKAHNKIKVDLVQDIFKFSSLLSTNLVQFAVTVADPFM